MPPMSNNDVCSSSTAHICERRELMWAILGSETRATHSRAEFRYPSPGGGEGFPHAVGGGGAGNVVAGKNRLKSQAIVEVAVEFGAELAQFVQGKAVELAALVQA